MNVSGNQAEVTNVNVLPLFDKIEIPPMDPSTEIIDESAVGCMEVEEEPPSEAMRKIVQETQFPDQSMFVLDEQLKGLRESLNRLKFYLGDLDDLLPR